MDFKKIKEQIRWIRRQYGDVVQQKQQEKEEAKKQPDKAKKS